jgi:oxygen-dependent protoporphyrinogen oxidase
VAVPPTVAEPGPTVAVVGAGIAGLAAAWELTGGADGRPVGPHAPRVVVLDAAEQVGGLLRSASFADRAVDLAADGVLARRPEAVDLAHELGIGGELVPAGATGASVWARGRLRPLPRALSFGVPTRWWPLVRSGTVSLGESLDVLGDLVRPHRRPEPSFGDRSVGEIVEARLGRVVVERLVDPLVGGIHAGSADELSAAALFPLLIAADQQPGSLMRGLRRAQAAPDPSAPVFVSLRSSTASLATSLAAALAARGVEFRHGTRVDTLEGGADDRSRRWVVTPSAVLAEGAPHRTVPAASGNGARVAADTHAPVEVDGVVLAVPARQAAVLLAPLAPEAAGMLAAVPVASVATVTVALPPGTVGDRPGTGFLVPRTTRMDGADAAPLVTAVTYLDRKWPHLCAPGADLVRLSVGRHGDTRHESLDDDELVAHVTSELAQLFSDPGPPSVADARVARFPAAFPQYTVGHLLRVGLVEQEIGRLGSIALAGASYRGVGVPACIAGGRAAARRVLDALAPGPKPTTAPAGRTIGDGSG